MVGREVERLHEVNEPERPAVGSFLDVAVDALGQRLGSGASVVGNAERECRRVDRRGRVPLEFPGGRLLVLDGSPVAVENPGDPVELGQQVVGSCLVGHWYGSERLAFPPVPAADGL